MGKKSKDTRAEPGKDATSEQVEDFVDEVADRGVWIRDDGAICFGGECVVMSDRDGEINFEIDPSACGAETGKAVLDAFVKNIASQKPINIKLKPKKD